MINYSNTTEMSMVISKELERTIHDAFGIDETLFWADIFKRFVVIALRNSCFCNYNAIMITFVMYNCAVTITVTFVLHYGAPVSVTLDKKSRINLHLSLAVISCCALTICPHHVHFLYCHTVSHRLRFRGLIFSARNHISYKTAFPTLNKSFTPFFLKKEAIKQH